MVSYITAAFEKGTLMPKIGPGRTVDRETPPDDQPFLVATLGDALREGLTQLVIQDPPDPLVFLADFLKSYSLKRTSFDY
eukprot:TsM_000757600 transcript=TsM_000757600 gene=TsM_000757600